MLDGVLEVEHRREFVSGVDAHELLLARCGHERPRTDGGALARCAALRAGARPAPGRDAGAAPLPVRPPAADDRAAPAAARRRRQSRRRSGSTPAAASAGLLGRAWVEDPSRRWRLLPGACSAAAAQRGARNARAARKLYVSPSPRAGRASRIAAVADVLGDRAGVVGFKVARRRGWALPAGQARLLLLARRGPARGGRRRSSRGSRASPRTACRSPPPIDPRRPSLLGARPTGRSGQPDRPHGGELAPAGHATRRGAARDRARIALRGRASRGSSRSTGSVWPASIPTRGCRARTSGGADERYTVTEPVVLPPDAVARAGGGSPGGASRRDRAPSRVTTALTRPLSRNPSTIVDLRDRRAAGGVPHSDARSSTP